MKVSFEYRPSEKETKESRDPWDTLALYPFPHASLRNAARDGRIDWDDNKNRLNKENHTIGFERIKDFEHPPIIDITLFVFVNNCTGEREFRVAQYVNIDEKIYIAIYVWRGEDQKIARMITLHRLNSRKQRFYNKYIRDASENIRRKLEENEEDAITDAQIASDPDALYFQELQEREIE